MGKDSALVVLTPYESRRLIAKAVSKLSVIKEALQSGWIIIATGSSTGYVAEEITGNQFVKENFISGHITLGETWGTPQNPDYIFPIILYKGQRQEMRLEEALKNFSARDVFIKGANAVDAQFNAGVFMGSEIGGTMGAAIGTLYARGSHLIVPVGLEKMIPSILEAAKHTGIMRFKYHTGMPIGMMPLVNATVMTEIQALALLFDVEAFHIGAGGIAGSEGSVVLAVEGETAKLEKAFSLIQSLKGEKPLVRPNGTPQQ